MANKPKGIAWGGARAGAGRKPIYKVTKGEAYQMLKAAKKREKEEGRSINEILLDIIYGNDKRNVLAAIKLFKDYTIPKHTEQEINITKTEKPTIFYPERKPDPAKLIPIKGGA
jgi:hypothetical protein